MKKKGKKGKREKEVDFFCIIKIFLSTSFIVLKNVLLYDFMNWRL